MRAIAIGVSEKSDQRLQTWAPTQIVPAVGNIVGSRSWRGSGWSHL